MANPKTPAGRVSFPSVFEPTSFEGSDPKYEITLLFDKEEPLTAVREAIKKAVKEKYGDKKPPSGFRTPIRDGDEKGDKAGYAGCNYIRFSSKYAPRVVGENPNNAITKESGEFYAGCWARASFRAFCYDAKGNRGVSLELVNVQKTGDDEPFGRGPSDPADDFEDAGVAAVAGGMESSDWD